MQDAAPLNALCNKIVAHSNKKAVALFNNRPSRIIITLDTLCNKFEMDGRRTVNPNNKSSSSTAQDKSTILITVSAEQFSGFREIFNVRQYGYKADPLQLTTEIKEVRHEGGHVVFTTKGRRSSKQIRSLFPKLTAAVQHQLGVRKNKDLVAIQSEVAHETLRSILLNEMPTPDHPTWF